MPKLWKTTIAGHRHEVRSAILHTAATLATENGLKSVTMIEIASRVGIGRATLYKYFDDVPSILSAWHRGIVETHLAELRRIETGEGSALTRLRRVLSTFAQITREHRDSQLAALLHQRKHVKNAHRKLHALVRNLIAQAADAREVRDDVKPDELATFCLHALTASSSMSSPGALARLLNVTLAGLQGST